MSAPVLYDVLGPKARRRSQVVSVVVVVALVAVSVAVLVRLGGRGQLEYDKWGPVVDPTNVDFLAVWERLGEGLLNTVLAAVLAIVASLVIGTTLAVARLSLGRTSRLPVVAVVEVLRGVPVVLSIYFADRLLRQAGVDIGGLPGPDGLWTVVIGLTAYNCVVIAEIVRSGVQSLPRGQREAGLAVGLTPGQTMRSVQLPQAFRTVLPALISQLVVVVKDTSLAAVLGLYGDLLREARQLSQLLDNPLQMFVVVGGVYVLLNWALSRLAVLVERRTSRSGGGAQTGIPLQNTGGAGG